MGTAMIATLLRRPALAATLCGCLAVLMAGIYFRVREARIADVGRPVKHLVARRDLPAQTQLTPDAVVWASVPRQFVVPGTITEFTEAVGMITQAPLVAGEPITRTRLRPPGDGSGFAATIPLGMRAISLPVDPVSGVAGLVEPGNWVDLLATFDFGEATNAQSFTMTVLERVSVLAVDARVQLADTKAARVQEQTVTLAVTPDQAQRVVFAQESGRLRLALRPQAEAELPELARSSRDPANAASVTGMSGLVRRKEYRGR